MREKETRETKELEITIGFGTLFEVKEVPNRVDVILDVGEENWFAAARIMETEEGKKGLAIAGTGVPEYIEKITGELSFDEVIALYKEGARYRGVELSDEERKLLEEYSRKKPRTLRLNNSK